MLPALNEETNLPLVLEGLPPVVDEVVVVDGGSTDDTVAVAREVRPDVRIVRQTRTGKGNALACGFAAATGDIVVTLNADGSTDPGEIPRFVDALLAGAEVAHGSRFREGGGDYEDNRWRRIGNRWLNWLVNLLFGTRFTDLGFGYNAFWRSLIPALGLPETQRVRRAVWGDGPEIEPLINIRMATRGLRVVEVASIGYPRIHGERERHHVRECLRALRTVAAEYLHRRQVGRAAAKQQSTGGRKAARHSRPATGPASASTRATETRAGRAAQRARELYRAPEQHGAPYRGPDPRVDPYPSGAFPAAEPPARHAAPAGDRGDVAGAPGEENTAARHRTAIPRPRSAHRRHPAEPPTPRAAPPAGDHGSIAPTAPGERHDPGERRNPGERREPRERRDPGDRRQTPDRRPAAPRPARDAAQPWEMTARRSEPRGGLTVIRGERQPDTAISGLMPGRRPGHLRAVPPEAHSRGTWG